jgi:hypothetical protein
MALNDIVYDETQDIFFDRFDSAIAGIVFDEPMVFTIPAVTGGGGEISYVF